VEARHYRFRILNGSQARFYNLQLYYEQSLVPGEADLKKPGPRMVQIGTEGGFLPVPVALNSPPRQFSVQNDSSGDPIPSTLTYTMLMGPAERADVVIDFSKVPVGSKLILYNDAPAPFPMGDCRNDYLTGCPDQTGIGGAPSTKPGMGANTRTLMQIRVVPRVGAPDPLTMNLLETLALNQSVAMPYMVPQLETLMLASKTAHTRDLTLNEDFDGYGRLIQMLRTNKPTGVDVSGAPFFGRGYTDPVTETVKNGGTEVWRIFNLTGDTHPIHFHLVNVRVLSRQPFDADSYLPNPGNPSFTGPARQPDLNELGMKEAVRMHPGECTTVVMTFKLPVVSFAVPNNPRTGGAEYVWHCHILEHEEHDMMRPLVVV
jgi:spore coat protein A